MISDHTTILPVAGKFSDRTADKPSDPRVCEETHIYVVSCSELCSPRSIQLYPGRELRCLVG